MSQTSALKLPKISALPWEIILPSLFFFLGVLLRLGHALYGESFAAHMWSDMKMYTSIASDIDRGIWREIHYFQSIGYPLIIHTLGSLKKLSILHVIVSSLTLACMYLMTLEGFGKRPALIALIIGTFHLPWILFVNFTLPETLFCFLLSVCGFASIKILKGKNPYFFAAVWGFAFEFGMWLKGTHVFMGPIFLLALLIVQKRKALIPCAIISSIVLAGILLHGAYSQFRVGKTLFSATAGGLNFVEGKCPSKNNQDSQGFSWQSPMYHQLNLHTSKKWPRPFTDSKYFFKEGLNCIKKDPFVLVQSLEGIPLLLAGNLIWPLNVTVFKSQSRLYELYYSIFVFAGCLLFFLYTIRSKDFITVAWIAPMLAVFLCVYIFKSEARFRVPFDLWFISASVIGWFYLMSLQQRGRHV